MPVVNRGSGTCIDEIAAGIYRISTPVPPSVAPPSGFTFNQYLLADEEPLLFHTGPRGMFPLVREAVAHVLPPESLRWIGFSHHEPDESGSLEDWLAAAPASLAVCGRIAAMLLGDLGGKRPRALGDGEVLSVGKKQLRWIDAPHVPHGWDCGLLFESTTRTFLCGDLFTQPGAEHAPVTEADILGPSEAMRGAMDYYAHSPATRATLLQMTELAPTTLACMHGSAWRGDGARLLRELADRVAPL